jgi:hypothetical protein
MSGPDPPLMLFVSVVSAETVHHRVMMIWQPLAPFKALALCAALLFVGLPTAQAGDDARDQEIARKALSEGRIRSLSEITKIVKPKLPGNILAVELEVEDDGRLVYEFDVIDARGKVLEVDVDAATGDILSIEDDD